MNERQVSRGRLAALNGRDWVIDSQEDARGRLSLAIAETEWQSNDGIGDRLCQRVLGDFKAMP